MKSLPRHLYWKVKNLSRAAKFYLFTRFVSFLPSHLVRTAYLKWILHVEIGRQTSIQMGFYLNGSNIRIGNHSVINRNCNLDGRVGVEIGDCVSMSQETIVLSMTHDPQHAHFGTVSRKVIIEDFVWIGVRAMILPGVTLGKGCIVAAGAVVTKSVVPYDIVAGVPARTIGARTSDLQYHNLEYFPYFDTDIV